MIETFYEVMRRQGISRRSFLNFCSLTTTSLGLGPAFMPKIVHAMETKLRTPVLWLHGLECTWCSESFIRSAHPLAKDVALSMISLDYDDLLMAAAGHQAEAILENVMEKYRGNYILAVEGNPSLNQDGMSCIIGGKPFVDQLRRVSKDAKAVISWGSCASWGCVQTATPNPTQAVPIHKVITDKAIIKGPGCPPIAEVMTGVVTYMLTFDRIPELDRQGRPKMFYSQRIHDRYYRRPHFDAGQFVERGTTKRHGAATASTRSAARARRPTTPARPCVGTAARASPFRRATAASAALRKDSGTRAPSTIGSPGSISSESKRTPTRSALPRPSWWAPPLLRMQPLRQFSTPGQSRTLWTTATANSYTSRRGAADKHRKPQKKSNHDSHFEPRISAR
ncbi:hydrogenase small subunit [Paraburkholderia sp. JPY681]|uniref:hydrogenase (acceptor) n=1 Tax=Paraburkholderia atlantica TaxID=2654982 RepID=D5WP31_PARAM|nr:hydrogenase (NiFe) small subunit HydA [Paraburkholderia atlantica]MBB5511186.1 hydrogenase small subunit [Paraburkholderia atlantica]